MEYMERHIVCLPEAFCCRGPSLRKRLITESPSLERPIAQEAKTIGIWEALGNRSMMLLQLLKTGFHCHQRGLRPFKVTCKYRALVRRPATA